MLEMIFRAMSDTMSRLRQDIIEVASNLKGFYSCRAQSLTYFLVSIICSKAAVSGANHIWYEF